VARPRSFSVRLGSRIRARRKARGWSQAELAEAVGVGANYIGILERGQKLPTLNTLVAAAKALGCSPAELLDDARAKDPWLDEAMTIVASVPKARRELALAVLKAMASNSTG
jgi:transcriptional regulator with XRE-family HTH domain